MVSVFVFVLLLLSPSERDSILTAHPAGAVAWEEMYQQYSGDTLRCMDYLLLVLSDTDRDSMTVPVLRDHVLGALGTRYSWFPDLRDSVFLDYLLEFRISSEPLSAYRSSLAGWLDRRLQASPDIFETASMILDVVTSNIALTSSTGQLPAPTQIIPMGQASPEGRWVLSCACMRSVGIPVRPVKGWFPGADRNLYYWMEVWTGTGWEPLTSSMPPLQYVKAAVVYPDMMNITYEYRGTGILILQPLVDQVQGWSVELMIPSGEDTVSISGIPLDPFLRNEVELGAGEFLLRVSFEQGGETIGTWQQTILITTDEPVTIDLTEAQYAIVPLP
ncbi:MAG: hypothetical protein AVO35_02480 [Candidatus Aegiribacteria sp. MLS_C]|nr:MAG: hypothetical protein AVO35_02480 [Candidatus Aegiribacteria sp. MLS_C]